MPFDEDPHGRTAPGRLWLVQALCNTVDFEHDYDELSTPEGLAAWLEANGFAAPDGAEGLSGSDIDMIARFREALRDWLTVPKAAQSDTAAVVERGRAALDVAAARLPLTVGFGPQLSPRATRPGVEGAMSMMLAGLLIAQADGTLPRLKACEADSCRWVFFDKSRNGSGRWCTMRLCGSRTKNRAYRARKRDAADGQVEAP